MKTFLFKRNNVYHLQYFDFTEFKIRRISTKCTTKNEANKFLIEFNSLREKKNKTFILLSDFTENYLSFIQLNHSKNYYKSVSLTFNQLLSFIGNLPLYKITSDKLEKFLLLKYQNHKYMAKMNYVNLKVAFNKAIQWNYISANPLSKIKLPKIPKNNPFFINNSELQLILNMETDPQLKNIYLFAFHTGMRLSEILNLKWTEINLNERIIEVKNSDSFTTKGKAERIIPINETLFTILQDIFPKLIDLQTKNLYVFNKNGSLLSFYFVSKRFKKIIKKLPLNQKLHFHSLRHSFASNIVQKTGNLFFVKELLGHKDFSTTQIYSHLQLNNLREAVKCLESYN
jgi:site-specific recombinase XerD